MSEHRCDKCDREFGSKDALNMHNKAKHTESYKEPKIKLSKKQKSYLIIFLVILAVGGFFYWRSIPPENAPIIEITPESYNFGVVRQSLGAVSTIMTVSNIGNEPLVLTGMDTSCGCTSASIISNGEEGPKFSMAMHGTNPKNWEQVIPPGESVQLKVYYDPNVHKNLRGVVTRSISIFSNDPRHRRKEVIISANQVN